MSTEIIIDAQFCGPKDSGNGGYVCGLMAQLHSLDWRPHADDSSKFDSPFACIDSTLGLYRKYLDSFPVPGLDEVMLWLDERREQVPCPALMPL